MLESLSNKAAGCSFIKKRLQRRCFSVKFAKFLRKPILKNTCVRLILVFGNKCNNRSKEPLVGFVKVDIVNFLAQCIYLHTHFTGMCVYHTSS